MLDYTDESSDFPIETIPRVSGILETAQSAQDAAEALYAALAMQDSNDCRECGLITSGSVIGGSFVPLCDQCLCNWMIAQLGSGIIRQALSINA